MDSNDPGNTKESGTADGTLAVQVDETSDKAKDESGKDGGTADGTPEKQIDETSDKPKDNRVKEATSETSSVVSHEESVAEKSSTDSLISIPAVTGDEDVLESASFDEAQVMDRIPDDFNYDSDCLKRPVISDDTNDIPENLLTLMYSYGYDCTRRSNLHVLDGLTVAVIAGSYVVLINLTTRSQKFVSLTSGCSAGALVVHPSREYFAIGECGEMPNITIYQFPSLSVHRILKEGAQKSYVSLDFSPDGELLASVSGAPDYMLTIWTWRHEWVMLRCKAFSQDVSHVSFSPEIAGMLTTAGTGHIRFWKMAHTFTGLKLQGHLGKFGKKQISDIEGYVELPSGKVVSGSEWGNLLLWDGELCKIEFVKRNGKNCHNGSIQQIVLEECELITVGTDGYLRTWEAEHIEMAKLEDEDDCVKVDPQNELKVGNGSQLFSVMKVKPGDAKDFSWVAQDACGAIWKLDLSFANKFIPPQCMMTFHSGPILACATAPVLQFVASAGHDGSVRVYDGETRQFICSISFKSPATSILWMPACISKVGASIAVGFEDGFLRVVQLVKVAQEDSEEYGRNLAANDEQGQLVLSQVLRPHNSRITCMAIDSKCQILATGSADSTVFFLRLVDPIEPVGFIKTPSAVTCLTWTADVPLAALSTPESNRLLVCCVDGSVFDIVCPIPGSYDVSETFHLKNLKIKTFQFKSIKSVLLHEQELKRKEEEEEERRKEFQQRKEKGLVTEEELLAEEEEEEEEEEVVEWEPYYPDVPSPILCGFYDKNNRNFWLSMGGYDAGYFYLCEFGKEEPIRVIEVEDANDAPVCSISFYPRGNYVAAGFQDGRVRIYLLDQRHDFGSLGAHWTRAVHNWEYGDITSMAFSSDGAYLYTVGLDGNFFSFLVHDVGRRINLNRGKKSQLPVLTDLQEVDGVEDPNVYSIEQAKQRTLEDQMLAMAEEKKRNTRKKIEDIKIQFRNVVSRNMALPPHLRLHPKEFELDVLIRKENEALRQAQLDIVEKQMAWDSEKCNIAYNKLFSWYKKNVACDLIVVKALLSSHEVSTFRTVRRSRNSSQLKQPVQVRERRSSVASSRDRSSIARLRSSSFLSDDSDEAKASRQHKLRLRGGTGMRVKRALRIVAEKAQKRQLRKQQWQDLLSSWHPPDYEDPDEMEAIEEARLNTGEFPLKSSEGYIAPEKKKLSAAVVEKRIIAVEDRVRFLKNEFNSEVLALRKRKLKIMEEYAHLRAEFDSIQGLHVQAAEGIKFPTLKLFLQFEENPERRYEYNRKMLKDYKQMLKQENHAEAVLNMMKQQVSKKEIKVAVRPTWSSTFLDGDDDVEPNELELLCQADKKTRMEYRQNDVIRMINEMIAIFDADVKCLRHKRFELDVDLFYAEIQLMVLYKSHLLLTGLEKEEDVLLRNLDDLRNRHNAIVDEIDLLDQIVESCKQEIEVQQKLAKELEASVVALVGDNLFASYLMRVFKKHMKRKKKKPLTEEGEEEENEASSSESESESESDVDEGDEDGDDDEDEEEIYDLDFCPPGCNAKLYSRVEAEREKRLDIEEIISDCRKQMATASKDLEIDARKLKQDEVVVNRAEEELLEFQRAKQRSLNTMECVVPLRLHQIEFLVDGQFPDDLEPGIVIDAVDLKKLKERGVSLIHDKRLLKQNIREDHQKYRKLMKSKRLYADSVNKARVHCNQLLKDKFGRQVSIAKLENVTVNEQLEELKVYQSEMFDRQQTELEQLDKQIAQVASEKIDRLQENTNLTEMTRLTLVECRRQEADLNILMLTAGNAFERGMRLTDEEKHRNLEDLLRSQREEISQLKELKEILLHQADDDAACTFK